MDKQLLQNIVEGALLAFAQPLSIERLYQLFVDYTAEQHAKAVASANAEREEGDPPVEVETIVNTVDKADIVAALEVIQENCEGRGFELVEVASGWRFQVRSSVAPWINKLWDEKPQKYSRALLETLAIIAYRQPITRGDIEEVRGVAVSSHIIKTLVEREWIKVVGQRDVPGRPSLFATTKQFLDYFNLQSLEQLPSLRELTDIESLTPELDFSELAAPVIQTASTESDENGNSDEQNMLASDAEDTLKDPAQISTEDTAMLNSNEQSQHTSDSATADSIDNESDGDSLVEQADVLVADNIDDDHSTHDLQDFVTDAETVVPDTMAESNIEADESTDDTDSENQTTNDNR